HRLDRATSGVLLIAKNAACAQNLSKSFHDDLCDKTYWAIVCGTPPEKFDIEEPLIKGGSSGSERMYVDPKGKYARTTGRRLHQQGEYALVELKPVTGRTHQLRVHMAHLGTPIFGDSKYGAPRAPFMALHAKHIRLPDPTTGKPISFSGILPNAFERQLEKIGFENG
ncbi:MAG: RluA family pseudouridine synthase, partial [Alphaproteobacteria bacterium]